MSRLLAVVVVLLVWLAVPVGVFAQTPTPTPVATNAPSGVTSPADVDLPAQTVVTIPVLWGGAMPVYYVIYITLVIYGIIRILLGLIPSS